MSKDEHFRKLERMYNKAPINECFNSTIHIEQGYAEIIIPVKRELFHAAEGVHGSVSFRAIDDAASFAVKSLVDDVFVYAVSFTIYFTRPISTGEMRARGKVVHKSKRLFIADSEIVNSDGKQIARGNGIFMKSTIPLSPAIGYE